MPARKPKPRRRAARKPPAPPPPVAAPPKLGQPPFVPTDQDRQLVRVMVSGGIEAWAICECLSRKISKGTLRKHFKREIATGAGEANAAVIASLHKLAVGQRARPAQTVNGVHYHAQSEIKPEVRAAQWWTQARMGWKEPATEIDAVVRASVVMAEPMSEDEWFREYGSSLAPPGRTPTRTD